MHRIHIVPDDEVGDEMLKMYLEFWDIPPPRPKPDPDSREATVLWHELLAEEFVDERGDYGYGGDYVSVYETDHQKLFDWIVERERRLLGGQTLEECRHEMFEE